MKDYYSILGIPRYASEQTIKEAYRRLAKRWHPDANNGDENAQRMMQDLNRAKEVLFDDDTRTEYRRVLEMQDVLSAENIRRLRQKTSEHRFRKMPDIPVKPFARGRFIWLMVLIAIAIGVAIFRLSEINASKKISSDPVESIIKRNVATELFPVNEPDTLKIPDVVPERLAQMASVLAMMNEYKSAAKYWEKYLESDPQNLEVTTSLMLAYLHRGEYVKAVGAIRSHVAADTNQMTMYMMLGDYFRTQQKPFDAENAFEKVVELGKKIQNPSERIKNIISQAEKRIDSR